MTKVTDLYKARFGLDKKIGQDMKTEGTVADILNRRSHRRYTDEPVSEDLLAVRPASMQLVGNRLDLDDKAGKVLPLQQHPLFLHLGCG